MVAGIVSLFIAAFSGVFLVRLLWLWVTGVGWDPFTLGTVALIFAITLLCGIRLLRKPKR